MSFTTAFTSACLNRIRSGSRHGELQEDGHAPCTEGNSWPGRSPGHDPYSLPIHAVGQSGHSEQWIGASREAGGLTPSLGVDLMGETTINDDASYQCARDARLALRSAVD